ncbi:homocysteine S-methyltransferase family protein [Erythrobacter sp. THAF29]|uniref:homocysteine S-methyltransferase family protein n=1 Tax=Erythrobacter sp. THAF29 TaxID=2587851 RepID=UPI0012689F85|nr:homocysteine S-methyltransferase family protein [Erythrobacter sp. THAF29]QFT78542.1 bifunctional homocysteine S-methyltransferase/5,10-methylenetetrahydrofolate reductase protein [Erythrobacter sp. THAF29]
MALYRDNLPQLTGEIFLADAGMETDIIFNRGIDIREFASHTLLTDPVGRAALTDYLRGFVELAADRNLGLILDAPTWKAHMHWSEDLREDAAFLRSANEDAVGLVAQLRAEAANNKPIVINAPVGPRGDAYKPEEVISADEAEKYYAEQIGWLVPTDADMATALTFTQSSEAIGFCHAAAAQHLPAVVSFTVELDGRLPDGQPLREAVEAVDDGAEGYPAYFMINCAHPDHFASAVQDGDWRRRIRGIRANASRMSHAELDEAPELDAGDPHELARQYVELRDRMPWLNVFGGCCGSDLRHVTEIAKAVTV